MKWSVFLRRAAMFAPILAIASSQAAQRVSDISNTKHNLSAQGPGEVKALAETQVCVFCHTPHGATRDAAGVPVAPLWNRQLSTQTYTTYSSSSLDAETIAGQLDQPGGSSKLCLSCHDGTLAIGAVNVVDGQTGASIAMTGTGPGGVMPPGSGVDTGFTRNLGVDLRNDHPISLTYDTALANADGELVDPTTAPYIGVRRPGQRPPVPLETTGGAGQEQIQCGTCHDPHIRDIDPAIAIKFLRLNRYQDGPPAEGTFSEQTDIVCLACHDKLGWSTSAHADPSVADEVYTTDGASLREFPLGLPVWRAACLNCHDTHTVHGARRLLREGTDSLLSPKSGGTSAVEETCYQCHALSSVVSNSGGQVPDIRSEFLLPRHMPIVSADQLAGSEVHDITDADFLEDPVLLGNGNLRNRHAECTDCHNPHRLMRNRLFNGLGIGGALGLHGGAHEHDATTRHGNIASGVLRGSWGVEPIYDNGAFLSLPLSYEVKSGDGGLGASADVNSPHVTREYQICLKCHSDYAYQDNGVYPIGTRPSPGDSGGTTSPGTNNLEQYTNQAMEFQAPVTDQGEPGGNHRSWHPVMGVTLRDLGIRGGMSAGAFVAPWGNDVGNQTMYCSDCHGSSTAPDTVVPSGTRPWGPHGSENNFLLKGAWNDLTGSGTRDAPGPVDPNNGLCFKCHDYRTYADRNGDANSSGFSGSRSNNLHAFHTDRIERIRCSWCHAAVPHGWKNKALLVNLNDVGPEAGLAGGQEIPILSDTDVYDQGPYYMNSKLKVLTFAPSGAWEDTNCGSVSNNGGQGCPDPDEPCVGREWMRTVCVAPP